MLTPTAPRRPRPRQPCAGDGQSPRDRRPRASTPNVSDAPWIVELHHTARAPTEDFTSSSFAYFATSKSPTNFFDISRRVDATSPAIPDGEPRRRRVRMHQELGLTSGFRTYMAPDRNHVSTTSAERADGHRGTRSVQGVHWTDLQLLSSACARQGCNTSAARRGWARASTLVETLGHRDAERVSSPGPLRNSYA